MAPIGEEIQARLIISQDQLQTIYFIAGYTVGICLLWSIPFVKEILLPFKIVTVMLHELGHAVAGLMTGAKIKGIEVNPNEGGVTKMVGGNPYITLPAGYIASAVWGGIMIFAGFNVLASKVLAVILAISMLMTLFWAKNWLTRIVSLFPIAIMAFLWWFNNSAYLRYFVLFMGVMSSLYALWDVIDDLVLRKVNESDASQFSKLCCRNKLGPRFWGVLWFLFSLIFIAVAVFAAILAFKDDGLNPPPS
ncbi:hypothetical protein HK098_001485 [Nowakowskiella sp. JEL0407]|nr:hypothetical protein HK098_001485 [Nowakowskiella sp. JEL0407]